MKVLLRTLCGAEKVMNIDAKLREIFVPLANRRPRPFIAATPDVLVGTTAREFRKTKRVAVNEWGDVLPVYEEVP